MQPAAGASRKVLCVFPAYSPSFGTFEKAYRLRGTRAFMPPQGLLAIAAYLPQRWEVRFIDENIRRTKTAEFAWADAVFVSGMADYRRVFWRTAWPLLRQGRIEDLLHVGLVAHHLITFAREAAEGGQNASFYSAKQRARPAARARLGVAKTADFS